MKCSNCKSEFENDGLLLTIHGNVSARICPECLTGALVVQVTVRREAPGKPYEHQCYQVLEANDDASALPGKS